MRVRRGPLFWGLFLITLGAIPLLTRAGILAAVTFGDAWRWWPVLLIGIGLALLLGRGRAGIAATVVIALALGGIGGSVIASGSWVGAITACAPGPPTAELDRDGVFDGDATLEIDLDCGSVDLSLEPGSAWRAHAAYRGAEPRVDGDSFGLRLDGPDGAGAARQEWTVVAGADRLREVDLTVNAGSATVALAGGQLDSVTAELNAGDLRIDGGLASIDELDVQVNAGTARLTVAGAAQGSLSTNAGTIELCVPADADLVLYVREQLTFATNLEGRGLTRDGETWRRAGAGERVEFDVQGNAGTFTLDPEGGC